MSNCKKDEGQYQDVVKVTGSSHIKGGINIIAEEGREVTTGSETERISHLPTISLDANLGEQGVIQVKKDGVIISNVLVNVPLLELGARHRRFTISFIDESPISDDNACAMIAEVKKFDK